MTRRPPKKLSPATKPSDPTAALRQTLSRQKKAELVATLLELAHADRAVLRELSDRFDVATPANELVDATRQAIADATAFDPRDINTNFSYDYGAYREVQRNLARLSGSGQVRQAMELALELMREGSRQVEMSDEGMMTEDIEDCLNAVLKPVAKEQPAGRRSHRPWCSAMLANDRIRCIARKPLESLRGEFQRDRPR
jgi:hypothetical protein